MSMQVTDTISYINTSTSSVNSPAASGGEQYNHLSQSSRWSRLTLLEKRLAMLSSALFVLSLILLIVAIVLGNKCK